MGEQVNLLSPSFSLTQRAIPHSHLYNVIHSSFPKLPICFNLTTYSASIHICWCLAIKSNICKGSEVCTCNKEAAEQQTDSIINYISLFRNGENMKIWQWHSKLYSETSIECKTNYHQISKCIVGRSFERLFCNLFVLRVSYRHNIGIGENNRRSSLQLFIYNPVNNRHRPTSTCSHNPSRQVRWHHPVCAFSNSCYTPGVLLGR